MDQSIGIQPFLEFSKVVNKHVLGNQDEFVRLKDKLEMCEYATSKAGAAALGYLMAMEEMEELKSEAGNSVYDKVRVVVDSLIDCDGSFHAESACEEIFTVLYEWLIVEFAAEHNFVFTSKQVSNKFDFLFKEYVDIVQE